MPGSKKYTVYYDDIPAGTRKSMLAKALALGPFASTDKRGPYNASDVVKLANDKFLAATIQGDSGFWGGKSVDMTFSAAPNISTDVTWTSSQGDKKGGGPNTPYIPELRYVCVS